MYRKSILVPHDPVIRMGGFTLLMKEPKRPASTPAGARLRAPSHKPLLRVGVRLSPTELMTQSQSAKALRISQRLGVASNYN